MQIGMQIGMQFGMQAFEFWEARLWNLDSRPDLGGRSFTAMRGGLAHMAGAVLLCMLTIELGNDVFVRVDMQL